MAQRYKVIHRYNYSEFCDEVEAHLEEGWTLVGGASLGQEPQSGVRVWAQALVSAKTSRPRVVAGKLKPNVIKIDRDPEPA